MLRDRSPWRACGLLLAPLALVTLESGSTQARAPQPALASIAGVVRPQASGAREIVEIGVRQMTVGELATIPMADVARIALGNERLVKASVVGDNRIEVQAEAAGDTMMHVWQHDGRQHAYALHVSSARGVRPRFDPEGPSADAAAAPRVKSLAVSYSPASNAVDGRSLDAAPAHSQRMVQIELRIVEVKRSALDQLGIRWASTVNGPLVATDAPDNADAAWRPDAGGEPTAVATAGRTNGQATRITLALDRLERRGDAWTLAEPRLTCESGGEAKFVAGGEIPTAVTRGDGAIGTVHKPYGVVLQFKPIAGGNGQIDSGILIEVSAPDSRNTDAAYLEYTTHRTETQVATREGEPLIMYGLLGQKLEHSPGDTPASARMPILSYLFGSREARAEPTEVFVVAMPRVVSPGTTPVRRTYVRSRQFTEGIAADTGKRVERVPSEAASNPADARAPTLPARTDPGALAISSP